MSIAGNLLAQLDESFSSIEKVFVGAGLTKGESNKECTEFVTANGKKVKIMKAGKDGMAQSGTSKGKTVKSYTVYVDGKEYGDISMSGAAEVAQRLSK